MVGDNLLRVFLPRRIAGNRADCEVMIDQSRTIDNRRIKKRLGRVPRRLLAEIKEKLRRLGDL
jgi:mRNA-degrading endonuclease toxin of MazEF toxin-antitoxin module